MPSSPGLMPPQRTVVSMRVAPMPGLFSRANSSLVGALGLVQEPNLVSDLIQRGALR